MEELLTLGGAGSGLTMSRWTRLLRDGSGRYFAIEPLRGTVAVFDARGRLVSSFDLLAESVDFITAAAIAADGTLHIFRNDKYIRVRPDGSVQHAAMLPPNSAVHAAVLIGGDTLAIQADLLTSEHAGIPLHIFVNGRIVRSFGAPRTYRVDAPWLTRDKLATDGQTVWSARTNRYEVTRWGDGFQPRAIMSRSVDWFESWTEYPEAGRPPPPRIWDIHMDTSRRLWIHSIMPGPNWLPPRSASGPDGELVRTDPHDERRSMLTMAVDVVDDAGNLMVSARIPYTHYRIPGSDLVYTVHERDGGYVLRIARLSIQ